MNTRQPHTTSFGEGARVARTAAGCDSPTSLGEGQPGETSKERSPKVVLALQERLRAIHRDTSPFAKLSFHGFAMFALGFDQFFRVLHCPSRAAYLSVSLRV